MKIILIRDKWGGITTFDVEEFSSDKNDCIEGYCCPSEALIDWINEKTGRFIPYSSEHEAFFIDTDNLGGDLIYNK